MPMQYTTLGRTNLRVSVAGLGCGGNSRLGLGTGKTEREAVALVRAALDLGINFFDTAEAYETEAVLGEALAGWARDNIVVSSKSRILDAHGQRLTSDAVIGNLEQSLRRLRMDHIDIYFLHAVHLRHYDYVLHELVPALIDQQRRGTIRHLAISETPPRDPDQTMLSRALEDSCWDVIMLAFHMMNQSPRTSVFPRTTAQRVGTVLMFVVRNIFSRAGVLRETVGQLVRDGALSECFSEELAPLDFLIHDAGASSLTDAAYRFARHEPGADVVLFGTGDQEHLQRNVESLLKPPLPPADVEQLYRLFGRLQGVGLVFPDKSSTGIPFSSV
jgi:aryl-alcohol dehydrogenase-like predicted oxidoreductase